MTMFSNGYSTLRMPEDFEPVNAKDEFNDLYLVNTKIPMSIKFSTTPTLVGLPSIKEDIEKNSAYAVLGYFGILVLIPIIFAPNSKYARFHANQAVILFIINAVYLLVASGIIALLALAGKAAAIIAGLIFALFSLVIFVMWAKGLSNAASGRAKKLPLIGEYEIIDVD